MRKAHLIKLLHLMIWCYIYLLHVPEHPEAALIFGDTKLCGYNPGTFLIVWMVPRRYYS